MQTCAPCHSRRSQLAEGWRPGGELLDHYLPELLQAPLYHADGQIDDEVYVYGSFVQSRMAARGVTCVDCHDSHSGRLLAALAAGDVDAERGGAALAGAGTGTSALVRATALAHLARFERGYSLDALLAAIADPEPQVRHSAALAGTRLLTGRHWRRLLPLLADPVLAVRTQAAVTYPAPRGQLNN